MFKKLNKTDLLRVSDDVCKDKYFEVVCRCEHNHPQIVIFDPEHENNSYTDIFWVRCKKINKIIDNLEKDGWCEKIKTLFCHNHDFDEELDTANSEYILLRQNLIKKYISDKEKQKKFLRRACKFGLENIEGRYDVNCLHIHFAHYIASGHNPIGKIVDVLIRRKVDNDNIDYDECCVENLTARGRAVR